MSVFLCSYYGLDTKHPQEACVERLLHSVPLTHSNHWTTKVLLSQWFGTLMYSAWMALWECGGQGSAGGMVTEVLPLKGIFFPHLFLHCFLLPGCHR